MTVFPDHAGVDYDDRIPRLVPGYALALDLMGCMLAARIEGPCRVLVTGCGTGAEILVLARRLPEARFTAVDPSAGMLAAARSKLAAAGLADRVTLIHGMLEDLPEDRHDAATLSLVLHFLPDDGAKAELLADIARRLTDDGLLLILDAVLTGVSNDAVGLWLRQQGHDEKAANAVLRRMDSQWHRASPGRMCQLLSEAGFPAAMPFFQVLGFRGLLAGRKEWK